MEEEKGSIVGPIIAIIVIVLVFIIGVVVFINVIDFGGSGSGGNGLKSIDSAINGSSGGASGDSGVAKGEKEVEDYDLSALLEEKTQHLIKMNHPGRNPLFKKNMTVSDLSDTDMISVALDMVDSEFLSEEYCYNKDNQSLISNCEERDAREIGDYVKVSDVTKAIKSIFGKDFTPQKYYQYCPVIGLNKEGDLYYLMRNCEGTVHDEEMTYIYQITEKDGRCFVYIAYGIFVNNQGSYVLYTDSDTQKKYNGEATYGKFDIKDTNYKDFSKYKITFEKNGNDYIFSKIEKIEQ